MLVPCDGPYFVVMPATGQSDNATQFSDLVRFDIDYRHGFHIVLVFFFHVRGSSEIAMPNTHYTFQANREK